jgi:hypothetical protein
MTNLVDTPRAADWLDPFLDELEDEWYDAEFTAIIAANWDTEPP